MIIIEINDVIPWVYIVGLVIAGYFFFVVGIMVFEDFLVYMGVCLLIAAVSILAFDLVITAYPVITDQVLPSLIRDYPPWLYTVSYTQVIT